MSRLKKVSIFGTAVATAAGLLAIAHTGQEEGLRLKTYKDIVGVPTYCYGETRGAQMGLSYTKEQCDKLLLARLDEFSTKVEACVKRPMSDKTLVAFVGLAYNVGDGAFCRSTAVRLYNAGQREDGCRAMGLFNKAGGRVVRGLVNRRAREVAMCLEGLK